MRRWLCRLTLVGVMAGAVMAVRDWRRGRRAGGAPIGRVRDAMNGRIDPWLMEHGFAGGQHSEIGTVEHVGRKTGLTHRTPVYPTFVDGRVWIPLPYGEASQWAQNVVAAGYCQLRLHGTVFGLDEPQIVAASDNPKLPRLAARLTGWLGVEYLRLHRFAERPEAPTTEPPAARAAEHGRERSQVATTVPA